MPDAKTWLRPVAEVEPPDVWDEAVRRAEVATPHAASRSRFLVPAVLVAAAVLIGLILVALSGLRTDDGAVSTPKEPPATFVHPGGLPIAVDYPAGWHAAAAKAPPPTQVGPFFTSVGLVVSNSVAALPESASPSRPAYVPANPHLPDSFVTVSVFSSDIVTHGPPMPDSPLPLSMANAKDAPGPGNGRYLEAVVGGTSLLIKVEAGPSATSADLAAADAIVASIRPTRSAPEPVTTVPATTHELARPASEIAAAGGYIWIAEDIPGEIQKMDPSTGAIVSTIHLDGAPAWLAGGTDVLWVAVAGTEDSVIGIETATDRTMLTVPSVTGPLVQTEEGLWGFEDRSPQPSWMVVLDPHTGAVLRHVAVADQPFTIAASGDSVWMLDEHAGTVLLATQAAGDADAQVVTDHSAGLSLAGTTSGVYLSAWRGDAANDRHGPATSAFASLDGQVQPFGDVYNFRPMVVADDRVWFVAGPHEGNVWGLCGMRTTDGVVDRCADISVNLEGIHNPVAFEPVTGTLWAIAYNAPAIYEVNAP